MYKNLNYAHQKEVDKQMEPIGKKIFNTVFMITIIVVCVAIYKASVMHNTTVEKYINDNNYELTSATFYSDKIIIDGEKKDFIKINDKSINDYWAGRGYKPQEQEQHKVYYNGSKVQTKTNIERKVNSTNISTGEAVFNTILYSIPIDLILLLIYMTIFDNYVNKVLKNILAKKYIIKM